MLQQNINSFDPVGYVTPPTPAGFPRGSVLAGDHAAGHLDPTKQITACYSAKQGQNLPPKKPRS